MDISYCRSEMLRISGELRYNEKNVRRIAYVPEIVRFFW